jgi:hypothetical protein
MPCVRVRLIIKRGAHRSGAQEATAVPVVHRNEARGRCSYNGVLPKSVPQAPLSTPAAAAPTHATLTSTGANGGSHWRLDRAREEEKAGATAPATQRMCWGGAPRPS